MAAARLGRVQFRIMQALWQRGKASARELTDALNAISPIAHSTVQTLLRKMEDKGVVTHDPKDRVLCLPAAGRCQECRPPPKTSSAQHVRRIAAELVAHLVTEENISSGELQQLRELIDRHDPKRGKKR